MKKILLMACAAVTLSISSVSAQVNKQQKDIISLGGNGNNSVISIDQIIDYPMLIVNSDKLHVSGFEMTIRSEDGSKIAGPFISQSPKFPSEMVSAIEEFRGFKSILKIDHIMIINEGKPQKEESLEFTINE